MVFLKILDIPENLELNNLTKWSFDEVRKWRNLLDMNILRTPFYLTYEMQLDFYNNEICNRKSNHRYWGLYELSKGEQIIIACIGIINIQWENSLGEISLIVNPDKIKKGYGSFCVRKILDLAFAYLNLDNLFGECYKCSPNLKFWEKMIKKYDARTAILPRRKYYNCMYHDSLYFNFDKAMYINMY